MDVQNVLVVARSFVAAGWTQGRHTTTDHGKIKVCALGAIYMVIPIPIANPDKNANLRVQTVSVLVSLLPQYFNRFPDPTILTRWNDHQDRTQADVLKLFDQAIAATSKKEN